MGSKREEPYRRLHQFSENEKAMDQAEHAFDMGKFGSLSDTTQSANVPSSQIIAAIRANTADPKLQSAIRDLLSVQKYKEGFQAAVSYKLDDKFARLIVANLKNDVSAETYQAMTKIIKRVPHSSDVAAGTVFTLVLFAIIGTLCYNFLDAYAARSDACEAKKELERAEFRHKEALENVKRNAESRYEAELADVKCDAELEILKLRRMIGC
jgi:hypothetical protein